jgi:hypothetical protein
VEDGAESTQSTDRADVPPMARLVTSLCPGPARSTVMTAVRIASAEPWPEKGRARASSGDRAGFQAALGPTPRPRCPGRGPVHNGAGGRAFAAIRDLRLVDCRAAGRAGRSARSVMRSQSSTGVID